MSTHTPGPWSAYKRPQPIGYADSEIHYGSDTECIAEVVHEEGNALLMAAAPDLLEALRLAANSSGFQYMTFETREAIERAIAKANGREV